MCTGTQHIGTCSSSGVTALQTEWRQRNAGESSGNDCQLGSASVDRPHKYRGPCHSVAVSRCRPHSLHGYVSMALRLIVIILLSTPCLAQFGNEGKCLPMSPIVIAPTKVVLEEKSPLRLSCTILPPHRHEFNASDLYFVKKKINYTTTHQYVTVPHSYQAVLDVPQAHNDEFKGHIYCNLRGMEMCFTYLQNTSADVTFRRDPLMPSFNSCMVHNWERLECKWSPTRQQQIDHTLTTGNRHNFTYEFIYSTFVSGNDNEQTEDQYRCQCDATTPFCNKERTLNETCILHTDTTINSFIMGSVYSLNIHARTDRSDQEVTSWYDKHGQHFNTSRFVKPNPPENLAVDSYTNLMTWTRPASTWPEAATWNLLYHVSYTRQWQPNGVSIETTNTTLHLDSPYTMYHVNVTVKPAESGFWSDVASITYTTSPIAPEVNPEISVLGYQYKEDCTYHCTALLRWKPIKASEQHGPNFKYVILRRETSRRKRRQADRDPTDNRVAKTTPINAADDWTVLKVVPGYHTSFTEVDVMGDMEVAIVTENSEGQTQVKGQTMFVMEKDNALKVPEVLVVEVHSDDKTVTASVEGWTTTGDTRYFMFWLDKYTKETDWQELSLRNDTMSTTLTLEKVTSSYKYGLGKMQERATSGIYWSSQPIYTYEGLADAPGVVNVVATSSSSISLHWVAPEIQPDHGYISHYMLHFCSWDNDTNTCTEAHRTTMDLSGSRDSVKLTNLDHSTQYMINMTSVTRAGTSTNKHTIFITTKFGLGTAGIGGVAVASVIVLVLAIVGIYALYKKCKQAKKWYTTGIKIELPEEDRNWVKDTQLGAESVSSATPFLPYSCNQNHDLYSRSISINSMDSGLSLDDGLGHDEINGYARGGYISSPTPLKSIPEDTDVDDVFTTGVSQNAFVESYQVTPGVRQLVQNGYLSNQTSHNSLPGSLDTSRSGISKYAAVTIDGQNEEENKYNAVMFSPGEDCVRFGSEDRTPSPDDTPCTYTQIQDQTRPRPVHNPFNKAFWSANRGKPIPSGYQSHEAVQDLPRSRKMPRYHKNRNYVVNKGTFDPRTAAKPQGGYVANDGTFNPATAPQAATGYVANDGTFDPKDIPVAPLANATKNDTFGPKSTPLSMSAYVINDGSFDPKTAQIPPVQHAANPKTEQPNINTAKDGAVPRAPKGYIPNDVQFDPDAMKNIQEESPAVNTKASELGPKVAAGYVPNDGTFDPNAEQPKTVPLCPNGYVPNDGTFDTNAEQLKTTPLCPNGYVPNDGTFDPNTVTAPVISNKHDAQDYILDPEAAQSTSVGYVPNDDLFEPKNSPSDLMGYVPNDGSFNPEAETQASSSYVPNDGNCQAPNQRHSTNLDKGTVPNKTVLLQNNVSGYLSHDLLGSIDSLNHRLSAIDTSENYFDQDPAHHRFSHVSFGDPVNSKDNPRLIEHVSEDTVSPANPSFSSLGDLHMNTQDSGCDGDTADNNFSSQGYLDIKETGRPDMRTKSGRSGIRLPVMSMGHHDRSTDPDVLREHRKSAPGYVNIHPGTTNVMDCGVPTSISSISRQSGGFVTQADKITAGIDDGLSTPSSGQLTSKPQTASIVSSGPHKSYAGCNGFMLHDEDHSVESGNESGLPLDNRADCSSGCDGVSTLGNVDTTDNNHNPSETLYNVTSRNTNNTSGALRPRVNGVVSNHCNGYIKHEQPYINSDVLNDNTSCHSNCSSNSTADHLYRDPAIRKSENNNVTKMDFCRPSAMANSSAEPTGYIQVPLVSDPS